MKWAGSASWGSQEAVYTPGKSVPPHPLTLAQLLSCRSWLVWDVRTEFTSWWHFSLSFPERDGVGAVSMTRLSGLV